MVLPTGIEPIYPDYKTGASPFMLWEHITSVLVGAPDKVRTRDPLITNQVLYQLSYKGIN